MLDLYRKGFIKPIRTAKIFKARAIQETFRTMQLGSHIGKIVVELRDDVGKLQLGEIQALRKQPLVFDSTASYLLIGGLGGLGRSISIWMVRHGARNLTYLSRTAGNGIHDEDFVRELQSMGCSVQLVRGSVTDLDDVTRAIERTPAPVKGIIQMSMVLRDQALPRMTIDEWNACVGPKVKGTWNLHNITVSHGLALDFFVLFSSLSGVIGQIGQANYASANTFLDAFVHYRTNLGLSCNAIDIGAMEGAGYLFENEDLLRKMQGSGWRPVQEDELLEALGHSITRGSAQKPNGQDPSISGSLLSSNNFLLGISPSTPLSDPNSSARLRKDIRMAVYHNIGTNNTDNSAGGNDTLSMFLASAKSNPALLKGKDVGQFLAQQIGKKMMSILLKSEEDVDMSQPLTDLGMDSIIAVELRAWWKAAFGFDISVLELLGMGTLEALGQRAAKELAL